MNDFDWNKKWEYWKPLLQTNGDWDEEKIKNEMHDLVFVLDQVGKIYIELTGGLLSKPMYYAETILQQNEQRIQDAYDEGYRDAESDLSSQTKEKENK